MTNHFNKLTEAEQERLSLLIEECGKVLQAAGKIQRHGYESVNLTIPMSITNRQALEKELGDLFHAMSRMTDAKDVSSSQINVRRAYKYMAVKQYLHHQSEEPTMPTGKPICESCGHQEHIARECLLCRCERETGPSSPLGHWESSEPKIRPFELESPSMRLARYIVAITRQGSVGSVEWQEAVLKACRNAMAHSDDMIAHLYGIVLDKADLEMPKFYPAEHEIKKGEASK